MKSHGFDEAIGETPVSQSFRPDFSMICPGDQEFGIGDGEAGVLPVANRRSSGCELVGETPHIVNQPGQKSVRPVNGSASTRFAETGRKIVSAISAPA